jgi:hypothetical protein
VETKEVGDWVDIDSGVDAGMDEEKTLFKGAGWVYAPLL